jgi:hypothetical protein
VTKSGEREIKECGEQEEWIAGFIPLTPDDRVRLNEVADTLGVRTQGRECFIETIIALATATNLRVQISPKQGRRDPQLLAAAKAVRSAYAAVAKLTPQEKNLLGIIITRPYKVPRARAELAQKRNGGPFVLEPYHVIRQECDVQIRADRDEVASKIALWLDPTISLDTQDNLAAMLIEALDAALGEMTGRSPHSSTGARARPKGSRGQWTIHRFVLDLWQLSRLYGRVTLSNNGGRAGGTIVAILRILQPMLPKEFFPAILDYSFLRRVQKEVPPAPWEGVSLYSD